MACVWDVPNNYQWEEIRWRNSDVGEIRSVILGRFSRELASNGRTLSNMILVTIGIRLLPRWLRQPPCDAFKGMDTICGSPHNNGICFSLKKSPWRVPCFYQGFSTQFPFSLIHCLTLISFLLEIQVTSSNNRCWYWRNCIRVRLVVRGPKAFISTVEHMLSSTPISTAGFSCLFHWQLPMSLCLTFAEYFCQLIRKALSSYSLFYWSEMIYRITYLNWFVLVRLSFNENQF